MILCPVVIGKEPKVDPGALLGYPPPRLVSDPTLKIGDHALIRSGSVIYGATVIGDRLTTGHNVVIREENIIGDDFSIWSNSVVDYGCLIGNKVKIHTNVYIPQFTVLEDEVFVAPGATFANDLHPGCRASKECMRGPVLRKGCQIGVNATILPFVEIGERAIVGSGAVVVDNVPQEAVVVGNPARVICTIHELTCEKGLVEAPYLGLSPKRGCS
jgi:acetyltransferase-like isoleucine patch superfamily enzyme